MCSMNCLCLKVEDAVVLAMAQHRHQSLSKVKQPASGSCREDCMQKFILVMRIRGLLMFMFPIMAFDAAYYFFEGKKIISFCRGSDVCNIPKVFILK